MIEKAQTLYVGLAIVAAWTSSACSSGGSGTPAETAPASEVDAGVALTQPQIVGIVVAADTSAVDEAAWALGVADGGSGLPVAAATSDAAVGRFANPAVGRFAESVVGYELMSTAAIESFGIEAGASALQSALAGSTQTTVDQLSSLTGDAFDVAYLRSQLAAFSALRDIVENDLIPNATNPQFQGYIAGTYLPTVEMYLSDATSLLSALTGVSADRAPMQSWSGAARGN
jgi:predicted outer membrane protein